MIRYVALLWILFALIQVGYDSPDEHFPTLEAVSGLLWGRWTVTWEWEQGLRSWLQPLMLAGVLAPLQWLGVESRMALASMARLFCAAWSLLGVWALADLARSLWKDETGVGRVKILGGLAWPWVIWGTRFGSDAFGIPPLLVGFALLWRGGPLGRGRAAAAGALLALAFTLRFTLGVPIVIGFIGWFLGCRLWKWREARLGAVFAAMGAGAVVFAGLTALDAWLYYRWRGQWHAPAWEFFQFNVLQGSGPFHASPWYELPLYFLLMAVPLGGFFALLFPRGMALWFKPAGWALVTSLGSLAAFSFVRHQELRFVLPILPLASLALIPLAGPRLWKWGIAANAVFLAAAALLYARPHGGLVASLDRASREAGAEVRALWLVDVETGVPQFYVRKPLELVRVGGERLDRVCLGEEKLSSPVVAVSRTPCRQAPGGPCRLVEQIELGLGHRIRQLVSETRQPQWVYRCEAI